MLHLQSTALPPHLQLSTNCSLFSLEVFWQVFPLEDGVSWYFNHISQWECTKSGLMFCWFSLSNLSLFLLSCVTPSWQSPPFHMTLGSRGGGPCFIAFLGFHKTACRQNIYWVDWTQTNAKDLCTCVIDMYNLSLQEVVSVSRGAEYLDVVSTLQYKINC